MFDSLFPKHWSTIRKLMWLKRASGGGGGALVTLTGAIVSFIAKAVKPIKELIVNLEPQQDLHGQDAPYPAGGGENKFNIDGTKVANKYIAADGTYTNSDVACIYTDPIPVQPNTTYTAFGNSTEIAYIRVAEYTSDDVFATRSISSYSYYPKVTFTTSANTAFLRISPDTYVAKIQVEQGSGQQFTPYVIDPYSNICPITGWTGVNVEHRGKNLFDKTAYSARDRRINTTSGGGYVAEGYTISAYIEVIPEETYTLTSTHTSYFNYYSSNTQSSHIDGGSWGNGASKTIPSNVHYVRFDYPTAKEDEVQLEFGSTASTYEPFSGTTLSVTFPAVGKNLYFPTGTTKEYDGGVLSVSADGKVSYTGTPATAGGRNTLSLDSFTMPAGTYTVSFSGTKTALLFLVKEDTNTNIVTDLNGGTFTLSETVSLHFGVNIPSTGTGITYNDSYYIQVEKGSSATSYEPYTTTVYGGKPDLVSGEMVIGKKIVVFDGTNNTFSMANTGVLYADGYATDAKVARTISNQYEHGTLVGGTAEAKDYPFKLCIQNLNGLRFVIYNPNYTTAAAFNADLADTPLQVVYELAEPITIQLGPNTISTLKGTNHVWANNNGEISVTAQGIEPIE